MQRILLLPAVSAALLIGCQSHPSTTRVEHREETTTVRQDANTVDDYAAAVQAAHTPTEEADALRKLHQWLAQNGFTFTTQAVRVADNVPIASPSTTGQPVSVTVTVYRGRDVVKSFSFVPKDNRNLALLGE